MAAEGAPEDSAGGGAGGGGEQRVSCVVVFHTAYQEGSEIS